MIFLFYDLVVVCNCKWIRSIEDRWINQSIRSIEIFADSVLRRVIDIVKVIDTGNW